MSCKLIAQYKVNGVDNTSIKEVIKFLDNCSEFCVDVETTGLCPRSNKITMLQLGNDKQQFVIDARDTDIKFIIPYLIGDKIKIGANLKFEYKMFLGNLGVRMSNICDIMIQEMIIVCGLQKSGFSLEFMAKKYLNKSMEKAVRQSFLTQGDKPFTLAQIVYGAQDVCDPFLINKAQQRIIEADNLQVVCRLENSVVKAMAEMEYVGMPIDVNIWAKIAYKNELAALDTRKKLDAYIIENNVSHFIIPSNLFNSIPKCLVDWDSPKEVAKVFAHLGIPTKILDKERIKKVAEEYGVEQEFFKDSVGGPELAQYADKYPIIPIYIEYQKYRKAATTFGLTWLADNISPVTGRVHTNIWQILKY